MEKKIHFDTLTAGYISLAIWRATNIFSAFCLLFSFSFGRRNTKYRHIANASKLFTMPTHPFPPQITLATRKLLVGSLPPEGVSFYFSNSPNTRLWDILIAIRNGQDTVGYGGYKLDKSEKIEILDSLGLGISDIIFKYEREVPNSTKDQHIIPKEYNDLLKLAVDNDIDELLFVYKGAYRWFLHSLSNEEPVRLRQLKEKSPVEQVKEITWQNKRVRCVLLPSPLSHGRKGETLSYKLDIYRKHIKGKP